MDGITAKPALGQRADQAQGSRRRDGKQAQTGRSGSRRRRGHAEVDLLSVKTWCEPRAGGSPFSRARMGCQSVPLAPVRRQFRRTRPCHARSPIRPGSSAGQRVQRCQRPAQPPAGPANHSDRPAGCQCLNRMRRAHFPQQPRSGRLGRRLRLNNPGCTGGLHGP